MLIFAESIDSVRTALMLSDSLSTGGNACVLAVASASAAEGKTSVATSLAVSFASATKKRTLLVDADLRSPDVAAALGVPGGPGLAELLSGTTRLGEALHRVGDTNTYVLPAGTAKGNPHHLVQSAAISEILDRLGKSFSYIIIDTPPVLSASESLVYAKAADFVVYCTLRDVSRAAQVRTAIGRLHDAGANLAGAVLSGVPCKMYEYQYGVYGHESLDRG
jgi:capsular exopolysaccharide synthesis family protein